MRSTIGAVFLAAAALAEDCKLEPGECSP